MLVDTVRALGDAIRLRMGVVVVPEEKLLEDAQIMVTALAAQPLWSDVPVIILSRSGAESTALSELLPYVRNVSVVERPIRPSTLVSLIRSNLRARGRQYQLQEHLNEQEEAQRAVRASEQRYRSLIDNLVGYAIFMIDLAGNVASWNHGAEQILGYSEADIVGKPASLLFPADDRSAGTLTQEMRTAALNGRAANTGWRIAKGGRPVFIEGLMVAIRAEDGSLVGFAKFMRDVTEQHRYETERENLLESERTARTAAERANLMKDEFLATLSHELRTPMSSVLGWTQILLKKGDQNGEVASALAVIERNARAQFQIIEDLLDMSSIISGKVRLQLEAVDLSTIVEAAVDALRPTADTKGISLQMVLKSPVASVKGDANRLQQVFWNLLTNAVKFTAKGGHVSAIVESVHSHVQVCIADTGEGIEPEFLPHLFDRFRQADASTARRHGGLGLGLSIVKQLVELHGGTVSAYSAGHGQGSKFTVLFPIAALSPGEYQRQPDLAVQQSAIATAGSAAATPRIAGLNILIVDDEPDSRALIRRLFDDAGVSVRAVASAAECMVILERECPDVLISDVGMPGEDGYSLIRRIRALPGRQHEIPAIALTAYARPADRLKAIQSGFQMHLSKPVDPAELLAVVASVSKRQQ